MIRIGSLPRRRVMGLLAWVASLPVATWAVSLPIAGLAPGRAAGARPTGAIPAAGTQLAAVLTARKSGAVIGRHYLAAHPEDADKGALERHLLERLGRAGWRPESGDRAALKLALQVVFREDFAQGDIVRVKGWVLARSEARLCALMAVADA